MQSVTDPGSYLFSPIYLNSIIIQKLEPAPDTVVGTYRASTHLIPQQSYDTIIPTFQIGKLTFTYIENGKTGIHLAKSKTCSLYHHVLYLSKILR